MTRNGNTEATMTSTHNNAANFETMNELTYGVEIEYVGLTKSRAASVIAETVNGTVHHIGGFYDKYGVRMADGRDWIVMYDGSVADGSPMGGEVVSPVLKGITGEDDDMEMLQKIVRALREAGARNDNSCGVHIHVGGEKFKQDPSALGRLVKIWYSNERLALRMIGARQDRIRRWCQTSPADFISKVKGMRGITLDKLCREWYGRDWENHYRCYSFEGARDVRHYDSSRYRSLNLHAFFNTGGRTVEFRCFNFKSRTLHAGYVKSWVQLVTALSARAINNKRARCAQNEKVTRESARLMMVHSGMVGAAFATARELLSERPFRTE